MIVIWKWNRVLVLCSHILILCCLVFTHLILITVMSILKVHFTEECALIYYFKLNKLTICFYLHDFKTGSLSTMIMGLTPTTGISH